MPTDYSPLLRTLCRAEVYFLMIGPAAVLAHAGELLPADQLPALPEQTALEIVPDPERQNLTRLAATLTTKISARLRVATANNALRGLPIHLDADLFNRLPVLPLTTDLGPLDVVSHPPGTNLGDAAVTHNGVELFIHGVLVPVAPIPALLGLAADGASWHDHLMAQLHTIGSRPSPALHVVEDAATDGLDASGCDDHSPSATHHLEHAIEAVLASEPDPMTVRQMFLAVGGPTQASYNDVRRTAEHLTAQSRLYRVKSGTAYRYQHNEDHDAATVRDVAALLGTTEDPSSIAAQALDLLGRRTLHPHPPNPTGSGRTDINGTD